MPSVRRLFTKHWASVKAAGTWKGQAYSRKEGANKTGRQEGQLESLQVYWECVVGHLSTSLHGSEKGVNLQERFQFGKDSLPPGQPDS